MKKKLVGVMYPKTRFEAKEKKDYSIELESLETIGAEIIAIPISEDEEYPEIVSEIEALIASWPVYIGKKLIASLKKCVVIANGSVGVDMIDVDEASKAGIVVTNVPDVFIEETADHTMMLLLATSRRVTMMNKMVREGEWVKGRPILVEFPRLWGQTLGLLGFGNIATAVARRAKGFGLNIIACDPYVSELKMTGEGVEPVSMNELLERSDYLTLHPALNSETKRIISHSQFQKMKKNAVLINCSRGGVVDEIALINALKNGKIAAAGLDVLEKEPPELDNPLLNMENVIITPHAASGTSRMRPASRSRVGHEIVLALSGKWPMSVVNPSIMPKVPMERWQPYPMGRGPNR